MVDQSHASVTAAGDDATRALSARLDELVVRVEGIGAGLRGQELAARSLLSQLDQAITAVEAKFAELGDKGAEHTADLAEHIVTLSTHAEAVGRTLGGSSQTAETLLGRVGQLREQVEASSLTISDTIPAALARIRLHAEQSLQAIATAGTRTESLNRAAETVSERLAEAEVLLERQRVALADVSGLADSRLAGLTEQTRTLEELLAKADAEVRSLSEGASGHLIEALNQVRDTAAQAADQARDAFTAAIPRVAQRMSESAARAMSAALADVGKEEIAAIGATSERAIQAAQLAAERLTRQIVTIAETSTAIEARIEANRADTEAHDDQNFARTAGLLIEALNSTSIDVAKIFSNEVTDEEWKAYLRGDRSIFTRRAVKLLDRADANAVVERYNEDGEFREQVNRYIHDFEALLRRVMATREGTPIATTMLSSDTGKLYVALAQAIERLRK
jgi:predicted  nucleic acid-binding Zn-ribbon protein